MNMMPGHAAYKDEGQEHDQGGQGAGDYGGHHFAAALNGRFFGFHAGFAQPEDILQDHDRIIHQHAHAQGQPAQGHQVQGEPVEIHERESGHHRYGYGGGDDGCAGDIAQEQKQHKYRQSAAIEHRGAHVGNGAFYIAGGVDDGGDHHLGDVLVNQFYFFLKPPGPLPPCFCRTACSPTGALRVCRLPAQCG